MRAQALFEPIGATRGKNGTDANGDFKKGDVFNVNLFNDVEEDAVRVCCSPAHMPRRRLGFSVVAASASAQEGDDITVDGQDAVVTLDAYGYILYHLNESTLNKALIEIEKALPEKTKVFVAAKGTAKGTKGVKKLALIGRQCVEKLKVILPATTSAQLKKMHVAAGVSQ